MILTCAQPRPQDVIPITSSPILTGPPEQVNETQYIITILQNRETEGPSTMVHLNCIRNLNSPESPWHASLPPSGIIPAQNIPSYTQPEYELGELQ